MFFEKKYHRQSRVWKEFLRTWVCCLIDAWMLHEISEYLLKSVSTCDFSFFVLIILFHFCLFLHAVYTFYVYSETLVFGWPFCYASQMLLPRFDQGLNVGLQVIIRTNASEDEYRNSWQIVSERSQMLDNLLRYANYPINS